MRLKLEVWYLLGGVGEEVGELVEADDSEAEGLVVKSKQKWSVAHRG
jgi:hypothetical protein